MLAVLASGCGQHENKTQSEMEVSAQQASFRDASPQQYLAAIFARYRNAGSYHDRGVVRLRYQLADRQESKIAPMNVWFEHNQLYVEAYDVHLWSDVNGVTAWISDESSANFDSQVLRLPAVGGRPASEALLSDPILAHRLAAGLAGPPPQLEWLFAREPMKHLFHGEHQFSFGTSSSVHGRLCRSVRVSAEGDQYQFWIDQQAGVVRQVDLPPIVAPPAAGQPLQTMPLSLELTGASFGTVKRQPDIKSLPQNAKYLRRFVPLPPVEPSKTLGSRPRAFRLTSKKQGFVVSDRGSDREVSVLVRFAGDPQSIASLRAIEQWNASMPESLQQRIRVAVLVDPQANHLAAPQSTVPTVLDHDQAAIGSLELAPGSLVILDAQGLVAWRQPAVSPASSQGLVAFGAIVGDVLDGVDVPRRVRAQWKEQVTAYQRVLSEESIPQK